jgi:xanthine dehydrogenase YagR molybdenum-binding subunit
MPELRLSQAPAHVRHGSNIGQPLTRRDGILKVTGAARYAADNHVPGMLYAVVATSSIARGRVTFLDVDAAKRHPGVVDVMTPTHKSPLAIDPDVKTNPFVFRLDVLQNDHVRYANQPIAVVIAETLEAATHGAGCCHRVTHRNLRVSTLTQATVTCRRESGLAIRRKPTMGTRKSRLRAHRSA